MNKLGFGFLRLPETPQGEVDYDALIPMVDAFLAGGKNYFDTAYTYLSGRSEEAIAVTLADRLPREKFRVADKLPSWLVKCPEDCQRYFREQCSRTHLNWFDVYLLHGLDPENYDLMCAMGGFDFLRSLKEEGKAKKIGFSFHGDAALLEQILTEQPGLDIVQLQINYLDWENAAIQSRLCYETACRHGMEIVVMEPVKGGTLATLPAESEALFRSLRPEASPASWAMTFVSELPGVCCVLSGMNTMEQLQDNLQPVAPLTEREHAAIEQVREQLRRTVAVGCTACRYCVDTCPANIPIPEYFRLYNEYARSPKEAWKIQPVYETKSQGRGKASACLNCGQCESLCPQGLPIRQYLQETAKALEA